MYNCSVEKYNLGSGVRPQFRHLAPQFGYLPMDEQLAHSAAAEFKSRGFAVTKLTVGHNAATLFVANGDKQITVIVNEHGKPATDRQREWAAEHSGAVAWCNGRDQAAAIADALSGGEFD